MEKIKTKMVRVSEDVHFKLRQLAFWDVRSIREIADSLILEGVAKDRKRRGLDEEVN